MFIFVSHPFITITNLCNLHVRIASWAMSIYVKEIDWSPLLRDADIESAVDCFCNVIIPAVDEFFPKVKVKFSSNGPAFISPRV